MQPQLPIINETNMRIILAGLRGSGKSTVGKVLSEKLRLEFIDLDDFIENKASKKIPEIVHESGWGTFRELERKACAEMNKKNNTVISTGGGTICFFDNATTLRGDKGVIILLQAEIGTLLSRLEQSYTRPLLSESTMEEDLKRSWKEREPIFKKKCDLIIQVDNKTAEEVAEEIVKKWRKE